MSGTCGYESRFWIQGQSLSQYVASLPHTSSYAHDVTIEGHSPSETLHDSIMEFSKLGDFNACIGNTQVGLLNFEEGPILVLELDTIEIGIMRHSTDAPHVTRYGYHLLLP